MMDKTEVCTLKKSPTFYDISVEFITLLVNFFQTWMDGHQSNPNFYTLLPDPYTLRRNLFQTDDDAVDEHKIVLNVD